MPQVVDNSSAFRMTEGVPLIIPEVNPQDMAHVKMRSGKGAIIANPNCSTIIALMAVTPLHRLAKVCPAAQVMHVSSDNLDEGWVFETEAGHKTLCAAVLAGPYISMFLRT